MPADLILMAISLFTWGVGEGMFIYFQPLYLQKWGANPVEIGAILSAMGVTMTIAQAPAGYLADRIGSRPVMWASWILGTIATVLMALAGSLPVFIGGLLLYGLTSFVVAPMNSYITSVRGHWSVERALNTVSAIFQLGAVLGPILGGWIGESLGLQNVYRISAGLFVLSTLIILRAHRPPEEENNEEHALKPNLAANPRFFGLLGLVVITMFALYLPQPLTSNYLQNQQGFSLQVIGQLGAVGSLGNAVIMLTLGHLNAGAGLMIGQVLVGLFALVMWQAGNLTGSPLRVPLFYIGYFFIGGYRLCRSMALAYARTLVKANETGLAYGLVETGNAIATIAAPLVAGLLYKGNPPAMYIGALAALAVSLLINFFRLPTKKQPAAAPQFENAAEAVAVQTHPAE